MNARLFEGQYWMNHGIDEAVRGLHRLKKAPEAGRQVYAEVAAVLEKCRAQVNLQFFTDMKGYAKTDQEFFTQKARELAGSLEPHVDHQ